MHPSHLLVVAGVLLSCGNAWAKLPAAAPVDPLQAEAAKKKAADTAKADAELLAKYQERAVANYGKQARSAPAKSAAGKK